MSALLAASLLHPTVATAQDLDQVGCTPVYVLQAPGTGFTSRKETGDPVALHFNDYNPALKLKQIFGPTLVRAANINYPSSLGRFSAWQISERGSENLTYGESVLAGVKAATSRMESIAGSCPRTKFILIGHSQGSSVVGDTAARVAAGEVAGVTTDDIAAVVMFADPGRSRTPAKPVGSSRLYAPVPRGITAEAGEIILDGGTGVRNDREGMTGPRKGKFEGLHGKVISLCHANDMACSTPRDSIIHEVADFANRIEFETITDDFTAASLKKFVDQLGAGADFLTALKNSGLGVAQAWSLVGTAIELAELGKIVDSHTRTDLPIQDLVALGLIKALPNIIYTGMEPRFIQMALDAITQAVAQASPTAGAVLSLASELFRAYAAAEALYMELNIAGWAPTMKTPTKARQEAMRNLSAHLLYQATEQAGLTTKLADPKNADFLSHMELAGDFGNTHVSYFEHGFYIDGMRGSDWVDQWLAEVTTNAIAAGFSDVRQ